MSIGMLTEKSLSLFDAVGGWRTVAEGVASRVVFLVAYQLTGQVGLSALIAVGGVLVLAVVRLCTGGKSWQPVLGLVVVGASALLAGGTGRAVDFYLSAIVLQASGFVLFGLSIVVRRPLIGLVMAKVRGEGRAGRQDRRYYLCTALFLAKFAIASAVLVPLYSAGAVIPLGVAATVLGGAPAAGACVYLCWRILRSAREVNSDAV
ncbi:DUF3159 domain-containing protein [Amycolatopsis sp. cg5]|uniref:DUF3159 domain-containing protein n=1 Tax=Amycolatopsis sp. cg5 TaxID=3238802 RepID=UPI0035260B82